MGTSCSRGLLAGRLNVLANVVRKPLAQIFSEFTGKMHQAHEVRSMPREGYLQFTQHTGRGLKGLGFSHSSLDKAQC